LELTTKIEHYFDIIGIKEKIFNSAPKMDVPVICNQCFRWYAPTCYTII